MLSTLAVGTFVLIVPGPTRLTAQVPLSGIDTSAVVVDSADVVSVGRAAQARFEGRRIRFLRPAYGSFGGWCDEIVGRICTTFDEGEWYPQPERDEIVALRHELIAELDSLQRLAPSSGWLLGQRVWYRAEAGDWEGAFRVASGCGRGIDPWWCLALEGFALHGMGRYPESLEVFEGALTRMDGEKARRWRIPRWPVDGGVRDLLEEAEERMTVAAEGRAGPEDEPAGADPRVPAAIEEILQRLWTLADPLWLVEGNDRLTAHYARWTFTEIRDDARNPFRLAWGDDLSQLTVRHGWQVGWERRPARDYLSRDGVLGHNHPMGRDFIPPGEVVRDPVSAGPDDLNPGAGRTRSLHAPPYAPVLLPMDGQVAVFPRGRTMAVVATHFLPPDTTFHAHHRHPLPWLEPGDQVDMVDRTGLFALRVGVADTAAVADGSADLPDSVTEGPVRLGAARRSPSGAEPPPIRGVRRLHGPDGASLLELPTGDYVVSAESWSPSRRRAGRLRTGIGARPAPPDVATLSDVLLLRPAEREPETLEGALDLALPRASLYPGEPFAIGWEVAGLGFRPETLVFEVSVERAGRSVLGRIGDFLGVTDPPRPLVLSWEEPGPTEPGHAFHYLELDLPELDEGEYEIRLVLKTAGRSEAVSTTRFEVADTR